MSIKSLPKNLVDVVCGLLSEEDARYQRVYNRYVDAYLTNLGMEYTDLSESDRREFNHMVAEAVAAGEEFDPEKEESGEELKEDDEIKSAVQAMKATKAGSDLDEAKGDEVLPKNKPTPKVPETKYKKGAEKGVKESKWANNRPGMFNRKKSTADSDKGLEASWAAADDAYKQKKKAAEKKTTEKGAVKEELVIDVDKKAKIEKECSAGKPKTKPSVKKESIKKPAAKKPAPKKAAPKKQSKKTGKKKLKEGTEIAKDRPFSDEELAKLKQEYGTIDRVDPTAASYKKLIAMLDLLPQERLKQLSGANVKFVSPLAKNRVQKESTNHYKEVVQNESVLKEQSYIAEVDTGYEIKAYRIEAQPNEDVIRKLILLNPKELSQFINGDVKRMGGDLTTLGLARYRINPINGRSASVTVNKI